MNLHTLFEKNHTLRYEVDVGSKWVYTPTISFLGSLKCLKKLWVGSNQVCDHSNSLLVFVTIANCRTCVLAKINPLSCAKCNENPSLNQLSKIYILLLENIHEITYWENWHLTLGEYIIFSDPVFKRKYIKSKNNKHAITFVAS